MLNVSRACLLTAAAVIMSIWCSPLSHAQDAPAEPATEPTETTVAVTPPPRVPVSRITLSPVLDAPLDGGSVVYCSTFRMAWDVLGQRIGAAATGITLKDDPALAVALAAAPDASAFTPKDRVVVEVGPATEAFRANLQRSLNNAFGTDAPRAPNMQPRENAVVAYAALIARLHFAKDFAASREPTLPFTGVDGTHRVAWFGTLPKTAGLYSPYVTVVNYKDEDDFTLRFTTDVDGEYLVLAKIATPDTLGTAIATAGAQLAAYQASITEAPVRVGDYMLPRGSTVVVPVVRISVDSQFPTLHRPVTNAMDNWFVTDTQQKVSILLNHNGAEMASAAFTDADFGPEAPKPPKPTGAPLKLVYDKPFLLAAWKDGAAEPYLAVWVNASDVLHIAPPRR